MRHAFAIWLSLLLSTGFPAMADETAANNPLAFQLAAQLSNELLPDATLVTQIAEELTAIHHAIPATATT